MSDSFQPTPFLHKNSLLRKNSNEQVKKSRSKHRKMSNSLEYPNKKCTFAYRVVRRSKSQNISALALSLNRYHKSATPSFQSDTQSDTSFLIIRRKDNAFSAFCAKDGPLPCDLQSPSSSLPLPYFLPTFFLYIHKDEVGRRWRPSKRKKELCRGKSEAFPGKKSLEKAGNEEKSAFSRHFFAKCLVSSKIVSIFAPAKPKQEV